MRVDSYLDFFVRVDSYLDFLLRVDPYLDFFVRADPYLDFFVRADPYLDFFVRGVQTNTSQHCSKFNCRYHTISIYVELFKCTFVLFYLNIMVIRNLFTIRPNPNCLQLLNNPSYMKEEINNNHNH